MKPSTIPSLYQQDLEILLADDSVLPINKLTGQWLLIANTASACGFNKQLGELNTCYLKFKDQGLQILATPSNQFGQEPIAACDIQNSGYYNNCDFLISQPIVLNGKHKHPMIDFLTQQQPGLLRQKRIFWNFTKFLVDPQGQVIKRFAPTTRISTIHRKLTRLINQPGSP